MKREEKEAVRVIMRMTVEGRRKSKRPKRKMVRYD